jgi:hypothetical protein
MSENLTDGNWCDDMMCHVLRFEVHGDVAKYHLAWMNSPRFTGTINRTLAAHPNVTKILVFAPRNKPVIYAKSGVEWHSIQGT